MFAIKLLALTLSAREVFISVAISKTIPISKALAFANSNGFRELHHLPESTIIVGVIAAMAILALIVMAVQRRRRRWF